MMRSALMESTCMHRLIIRVMSESIACLWVVLRGLYRVHPYVSMEDVGASMSPTTIPLVVLSMHRTGMQASGNSHLLRLEQGCCRHEYWSRHTAVGYASLTSLQHMT